MNEKRKMCVLIVFYFPLQIFRWFEWCSGNKVSKYNETIATIIVTTRTSTEARNLRKQDLSQTNTKRDNYHTTTRQQPRQET